MKLPFTLAQLGVKLPLLPLQISDPRLEGIPFPPQCAVCFRVLARVGTAERIGWAMCPLHGERGEPIYRLQTPRGGRPAGWPRCAHCDEPAKPGRWTCGALRCLREHVQPGAWTDARPS